MDERYAQETQTLRELLALMHEHDLDTIKVKLGDAVYELSRAGSEPAPQAANSASASAGESAPVAGANVKSPRAADRRVLSRIVARYASVRRSRRPRRNRRRALRARGDEALQRNSERLCGHDRAHRARNGELVSQGEELFWIEPQ